MGEQRVVIRKKKYLSHIQSYSRTPYIEYKGNQSLRRHQDNGVFLETGNKK